MTAVASSPQYASPPSLKGIINCQQPIYRNPELIYPRSRQPGEMAYMPFACMGNFGRGSAGIGGLLAVTAVVSGRSGSSLFTLYRACGLLSTSAVSCGFSYFDLTRIQSSESISRMISLLVTKLLVLVGTGTALKTSLRLAEVTDIRFVLSSPTVLVLIHHGIRVDKRRGFRSGLRITPAGTAPHQWCPPSANLLVGRLAGNRSRGTGIFILSHLEQKFMHRQIIGFFPAS